MVRAFVGDSTMTKVDMASLIYGWRRRSECLIYRVYVRCQGLWELWVLFSNYLNFQVTADRVKDYQKLGDGIAVSLPKIIL